MYANQEIQFSAVIGNNHSYGFGPFTTPSPSTPPLSIPNAYVSYRQAYIEKKPYKCDICRKRFTLRAYLKKHELAPEQGKHFVCVFCCKAFPERDKLKIHERTHTGERPFACDVCPMAFARKDKLKNHARTHTGEKPFVCHICPKAFSRNDKLKIHQRTHSGEKPFSCQICAKAFSRKDHLNKHERTHNNHFNCPQNMHSHNNSNLTSTVLSNAKCDNILKKEFLHGERHEISGNLSPESAEEFCKSVPMSGLNTPVVRPSQHQSYEVSSVSASSNAHSSSTTSVTSSKTTTLLKQPVLSTLNLDNITTSLSLGNSYQKIVSQSQRSTPIIGTTTTSHHHHHHPHHHSIHHQQQQQQEPLQAHYDWKRNTSTVSSWGWNGCPSTLTIPSYTVGQRKGDNQASSDIHSLI
ncbi:zinc finger protein 25-like [Argonauta hians]